MNGRPFYKNPFVVAFFAGIVTLTLLRPLLRREPEPPPVLFRLPAFSLVDTGGKAFGSEDLRGQVYIASFFFTRCPSFCPALMTSVKRLQGAYAEREIDGIRLVSITVDPGADTPEVLRAYGEQLGVEPSRWTLLTGDAESIRALVVDGFKTPIDRTEGTETTPLDIAHSGKLVLVDGSGNVRGYYGTEDLGLDEVYNRAQHVLKQERAR